MNDDTDTRAARARLEADELVPQMMLLCEKGSWSGVMTALTVMLVHQFEKAPRHRGTEPELLEFMRLVTGGAVHEFRNKPRPN